MFLVGYLLILLEEFKVNQDLLVTLTGDLAKSKLGNCIFKKLVTLTRTATLTIWLPLVGLHFLRLITV